MTSIDHSFMKIKALQELHTQPIQMLASTLIENGVGVLTLRSTSSSIM